MKYTEKNPEVLVPDEKIVKVAGGDVGLLKQRAPATARKRIRFCAHRNGDEAIHEMIIVMEKATYIRPHKHRAKVESFHVIEGVLDVVIFDETGGIVEIVPMGDYASGRNFFYRLSDPLYHTLVLGSETLIIHETTNGPFKRDDTIFASWAPPEEDAEAARQFMKKLSESVAHSVK